MEHFYTHKETNPQAADLMFALERVDVLWQLCIYYAKCVNACG